MFVGTLADGRKVDPFRGGAPPLWEKPDDAFGSFRSMRWMPFLINTWTLMSSPDPLPQREYVMDNLLAWLCNEWNHNLALEDAETREGRTVRMLRLRVHFMREHTLPYPSEPKMENWKLWEMECPMDGE